MDGVLRVTILKDNTVTRPGLTPGHGLAALVEVGGRRILFDTGPDASLLANAAALGLELRPLDAIMLSHGHADHTGGLAAALEATGPVKVVAHPGVFDRTYAGPDRKTLREISMPLSRQEYEARGASFELSELPVTLAPGLLSTGHVPPLDMAAETRGGLWRSRGEALHRDDFRDDCSLVALRSACSLVLTGCAHSGLTNILYKVHTIAPGGPPRVLLGGLHLGAASEAQVARIAREIAELGVRLLLPCHCTGASAVAVLRECFPGRVVPVGAGSVIRVREDGDTEIEHTAGSQPAAGPDENSGDD